MWGGVNICKHQANDPFFRIGPVVGIESSAPCKSSEAYYRLIIILRGFKSESQSKFLAVISNLIGQHKFHGFPAKETRPVVFTFIQKELKKFCVVFYRG